MLYIRYTSKSQTFLDSIFKFTHFSQTSNKIKNTQ